MVTTIKKKKLCGNECDLRVLHCTTCYDGNKRVHLIKLDLLDVLLYQPATCIHGATQGTSVSFHKKSQVIRSMQKIK